MFQKRLYKRAFRLNEEIIKLQDELHSIGEQLAVLEDEAQQAHTRALVSENPQDKREDRASTGVFNSLVRHREVTLERLRAAKSAHLSLMEKIDSSSTGF